MGEDKETALEVNMVVPPTLYRPLTWKTVREGEILTAEKWEIIKIELIVNFV